MKKSTWSSLLFPLWSSSTHIPFRIFICATRVHEEFCFFSFCLSDVVFMTDTVCLLIFHFRLSTMRERNCKSQKRSRCFEIQHSKQPDDDMVSRDTRRRPFYWCRLRAHETMMLFGPRFVGNSITRHALCFRFTSSLTQNNGRWWCWRWRRSDFSTFHAIFSSSGGDLWKLVFHWRKSKFSRSL